MSLYKKTIACLDYIYKKNLKYSTRKKLENIRKINFNYLKIISLKNIHKGQRCFIMGNGPSLNKCDLTKLKNEITFGMNGIYLNEKNMGFAPTYYCLADRLVAEDTAKQVETYNAPKIKFLKKTLKKNFKKIKNAIWFEPDFSYYRNPLNNNPDTIVPPEFSFDIAKEVKVGGTVTYFALQIAYYMGFSEIYLIGFDHFYQIPSTAIVEKGKITLTGDDPNHFCKGYFKKGVSWNDPKSYRMEEAYKKAKEVFETDGRKIYNATAGGKLEVFERIDYDKIFE